MTVIAGCSIVLDFFSPETPLHHVVTLCKKGCVRDLSVEMLDILYLSIDTTDNHPQKLARQEAFLLFV